MALPVADIKLLRSLIKLLEWLSGKCLIIKRIIRDKALKVWLYAESFGFIALNQASQCLVAFKQKCHTLGVAGISLCAAIG